MAHHMHSSSCYKTTYPGCGKSEHTHSGNACYKSDGTLKCSIREHTHNLTACTLAVGPMCGNK